MKTKFLNLLLRILNSNWAKSFPRGDYVLLDESSVFSLSNLEVMSKIYGPEKTLAGFVKEQTVWRDKPTEPGLHVFEDGQWRKGDVRDRAELERVLNS